MKKVAYTKLHARPATNRTWDKLVVIWKSRISETHALYKK